MLLLYNGKTIWIIFSFFFSLNSLAFLTAFLASWGFSSTLRFPLTTFKVIVKENMKLNACSYFFVFLLLQMEVKFNCDVIYRIFKHFLAQIDSVFFKRLSAWVDILLNFLEFHLLLLLKIPNTFCLKWGKVKYQGKLLSGVEMLDLLLSFPYHFSKS